MGGLALCNSLFFSYVYLEILTLGTYLLVGFLVCPTSGSFWGKGCFLDKKGRGYFTINERNCFVSSLENMELH